MRVQLVVAAVGGVGFLLVAAGDLRMVGYGAVAVTVASGAYLVVTGVLYLVARLFRSRWARRLFTLLTFQRAGQVAAGVALLTHVPPAHASAPLPAGEGSSAHASVEVASVEMLLHRFGLGSEPDVLPTSFTYTVVSGDSFWRIAERQVRLVDPDADVRTVATYWLLLVEENVDQLVVAGNPDLLYAGQVLTLPPMPDTVN